MRKHTADTIIEQILWIQNRNHFAGQSHRRKRLNQIVKEVEPQSEVGGHAVAAGAVISKNFLPDFIDRVNHLLKGI